METNSIEPMNKLIDMLDDIAQNTPRSIFSKGRISVSPNDLAELAQQMRMSLPYDMQQAETIVAQKKTIVEEAQREANQIITEAEQKRRDLLDQNSIVREAQARANDVINEANDNANMIRVSVLEFCRNILNKMDTTMMSNLHQVRTLVKEFESDDAAVQHEINRYASGADRPAQSANMPDGAQ